MRRSKVYVYVVLVIVSANHLCAQDSLKYNRDSVHLYFVMNFVPNQYNKTLNGLINISRGNHEHAFHMGLLNYNQKNFKGFQLACLNINRGNSKGTQVAFFNSCFDTLRRLQVGVINIAKVCHGGVQMGLISYCDTASDNLSISYLTIYRRGGYYGMEYYLSEMFPINISLRVGLSKRYNVIDISTDPNRNTVFFGGGIGFMKQLSNRWFFNHEMSFQSAPYKGLLSVSPKLTCEFHRKIYFSIGPSFVWNHSSIRELTTPLYALVDETTKDGKNKFVIGLRAGIRFNIRDVIKTKIEKKD